jgi:tetratricopeptide (TPR) repeat protein
MYRVWADWETDGTTRRQRLQQSLDHFLAAVELNPENPDLRLDLGGAYLALGDYQAAFTQYRHAVAIGSPYHLGRANAGLGNVYLAQGRLDEAAEAYREAMRAGLDREEVLQAQSRASVNHPEDIRAREGLALLYAAAGRTGDALEELNEALAIASSDEEQAELEKLIMMIEK